MNYLKIAQHYEDCLEKHGDTCKGVDWPNDQDASVRYKVMLELIDQGTLLDFGCGTARLLDYIVSNNIIQPYFGADISSKFVDICNKKYPKDQFFVVDIQKEDLNSKFDYIVCNGTFTEKRDLTHDHMWDFVTTSIQKLWGSTNKGIAFNLMSNHVDWERTDLFHVDLNSITNFIVKNLSRHFVVRNDYGLYEYTIYVYKEPKCKI